MSGVALAKSVEDRLAEADTHAKSPRSGVFPTEQVQAMIDVIDRTSIVGALQRWQADDEGKDRHAGGRPAALNYRALLVAMLLLQVEQSPFLTTELGNLFWRRLNTDSRDLLGIGHVKIGDDHKSESQLWYNRADRARARMFKLIDPREAKRQIMNAGERRYQRSLRDAEVSEMKRRRLDWFCNQLIEATLKAMPPEVLAAWSGDVAVDRTKIPAVSTRGRKRWPKGSDGNRVGPEPDSLIQEIDADWYMHRPEDRAGMDPNEMEGTWGYAANIVVATQHDPTLAPPHPLFAVGFRMSVPNNDDISEDTVEILRSVQQRGHKAGRVTGDKEYFAKQIAERLALPTRAEGYEPMTDYYANRLGVRGNIGGAIQVEGGLYCPSMPAGLVDATKLFNAGKISEDIYLKRVEEQRPLWEVRRKEKPDENGAYPVMCPAYGAGATIDCPLRAKHLKASKAAKPEAVPPQEHKRDRICTQTSVQIRPDDSIRYLQKERYGTRKWRTLYGHDRSQVEGFNSAIKDRAHEDIENTARRRVRGFTAATVATLFAIVSVNLRLTQSWLQDEADRRAKPDQQYKRRTKPFAAVSLANYKARLPQLDENGVLIEEQAA